MHPQKLSKLLSYALRHKPTELKLTLDDHGWADAVSVVAGLRVRSADYIPETMGSVALWQEILQMAMDCPKQRFEIEGTFPRAKIRARHGHSVAVDMDEGLRATPPEFLIHGTAQRNVKAILQEGLSRMRRNYVHMTEDRAVALEVGRRYDKTGQPVLLRILAHKMAQDGYKFFRTSNKLWLVEYVPPGYIMVWE